MAAMPLSSHSLGNDCNPRIVLLLIWYLLFCHQVRQYRDFISLLPEHLALRILSLLSPQELLVAAQVRQV
jgi:hypothetical protein